MNERVGRLRLLVVDDEKSFQDSLSIVLGRDYYIDPAFSAAEAWQKLKPIPAAVLLDLRLSDQDPQNNESLSLLREIRKNYPYVPVIMITAYGDVDTAVECMRSGAADFIPKTSDLRELRARIERALEVAKVSRKLETLERELALVASRQLVGQSRALLEVRELISTVALDGQVTVFITGETGTGKELVARAIHAAGPRAEAPFVGVAIAALPATTLEAELFGYEPGAFTDARRRHLGLIERAQGGILFLDEIGELGLEVQVKLLRFLSERTFTRLGGREEIPSDIQVVAATNARIPELIQTGRFREDLYYRLKVCEIHIPPLRERIEDLPLLVEHFLADLGAASRGVPGVTPEAISVLTRYPWPGNVRELRNVLEFGILRASLRGKRLLEPEDLPSEFNPAPCRPMHFPARPELKPESTKNLDEALAEAELNEIEKALNECKGRKSEAWKLLGLHDRFALRRRVLRLRTRFPDVFERFPTVRSAFGSLRDKADDPLPRPFPVRASGKHDLRRRHP